jgi:hypothetical protein
MGSSAKTKMAAMIESLHIKALPSPKRWGLPGGILTRFGWREKHAGYNRSDK